MRPLLIDFKLLVRCIEISLSRQTRLDAVTEARYNAEIGSPIYYNFPLLYLRDYCKEFLAKCDEYLQQRGRHVHVNAPTSS